jgi:magnesium transporter
LAYALIDAVIDSYFPILERIGDDLEEIEEEVFSSPSRRAVTGIQRIKSELREIRRACTPHRDVVRALMREDVYVSEPTKLYLRDCEDHSAQGSDLTDTYREVATDLMSSYLSSISNRMNEVMKFLTIIASVFIPLSFIAGLYGMNFDPQASRWNMPELGWAFGYPAALVLMLIVAVGMAAYFKKRGWFS